MRMGSDLGKLHRRNYMVKSQLKSLEAKGNAFGQGINSDTSADAQIDDASDYMQFSNLGNLAEKKKSFGHMRTMPRRNSRVLPAPKLPVYGQQRRPAVKPTPKPTPLTDRDRDGWHDHPTITNLSKSGYGKSIPGGAHAIITGSNGKKAWDRFPNDPTEWADSDNDGYGDNFDAFGNLGNLAEKKTRLVRAPVRSNTNAIAPPSLHKWGALPTHTMPDGTEMPGATHEGLDGWTDSLPQVGFGNTIGATGLLFLLGAGVGLVTYSEYRTPSNTLKSWQPRLKQAGMYGVIGLAVGSAYQALVGTGQQTGWY